MLVDVDRDTLRADPAAMRSALTDTAETTVLVVASAPSYAHGVIDPVAEIAAAAAEHGVRCHVDACIGGWVLPHLDAPPWTFAVDGVTSMSVDLHKYAYTPKGVSILLHRTAQLRRGHLFASAEWPGYTMLNSTAQSTKSGGPLAAAWAVVNRIGVDGYAELARRARTATLDLAEAARDIDGLAVFAEPDATLLALATDASCDVFTIADEMLARHWYVQPQMSFRSSPPTLHLTLSAATAASVPDFVVDLRSAVAAARSSGPVGVGSRIGRVAGRPRPGHARRRHVRPAAGCGRPGRRHRRDRPAGADGTGQRPAQRLPAPAARGAAARRPGPAGPADAQLTVPTPSRPC